MPTAATPSRLQRSWCAVALAVALAVPLAGCASAGAPRSLLGVEDLPALPPERNERTFGVRIDSVRLTAAGHMLDLRYTVTDPERAASIVNERLAPRLVVASTGRVLSPPTTPKAGALRQAPSTLEKGRVYFALFGNAGGAVKPGDTVRVVLGALEQDVPVE